jgi:ABC-2 type transport system permease protein
MGAGGRITAEAQLALRSFLRRRTAVFFTFAFPAIIVLIFGVLIQVGPAAGGLFSEPPSYYVAGYLAVVVLFTPLSRLGSTVARHRDSNRFVLLAVGPMSRLEWLIAHTLVTAAIVLVAAALLLVLVTGVTPVGLPSAAGAGLVALAVAIGAVAFGALGALIGSLTRSTDGVIAAANALALPLLFLSETFIPPALLPAWFAPAMALSPLTYVVRPIRLVTVEGVVDPLGLVPIAAVMLLALFAAARVLPRL